MSCGEIREVNDRIIADKVAACSAQLSKTTGSPAFFAPEMCGMSRSIQASCGDIWAMGVTLYAMCFGELPFQEKSIIKLYDSIKDDEPKYPPDCDSQLLHLFTRLLDKNPDTRITIEELRVHNWVTNNGQQPLISFEENCREQELVISEKDLQLAIKPVSSTIFTVMRAARKFKQKSSRQNSEQSIQ